MKTEELNKHNFFRLLTRDGTKSQNI